MAPKSMKVADKKMSSMKAMKKMSPMKTMKDGKSAMRQMRSMKSIKRPAAKPAAKSSGKSSARSSANPSAQASVVPPLVMRQPQPYEITTRTADAEQRTRMVQVPPPYAEQVFDGDGGMSYDEIQAARQRLME